VRCSVPELSRVGREIRRKTPSCSLRGEEGCSHSTAVGGKRASSFRSLTPFYRRYSLWPPPQPAPLSRPPVPARVSKHPSLVPIEKDVYLQAMVQPCLTPFLYCPTPPFPQAPVSSTNRTGRTWPRKRRCSPRSLLSSAAPLRPPLTRWCMETAAGDRHRVGRATRKSCRKPRNPTRGGGRRNPLSAYRMHSSLASVTEVGKK